jgi:hypothetical protein
MKKEVL